MLRNDLSRRAEILAESLQENVEPLFDRASPDKSLQRIVDRFGQREHLKGIAVYNARGQPLVALTPGLPQIFQSRPATATHAACAMRAWASSCRIDDVAMHVYAVPLHRNGQTVGTLVLVHDTSYIDTQVSHTLRDFAGERAGADAVHHRARVDPGALDTDRPLTRTAKWLRGLRTGQSGNADHAAGATGRRTFRSDSPRGHTPGARPQRRPRDRRRRSAPARVQRFAVDGGAAARQL